MKKDIYHNIIVSNMTKQFIQSRRARVQKPFRPFTNVPNRMEQVRVINDVVFINDAKAENVNATYFALQSLKKPIIWIAGGDDAGTDYWELMGLVRSKVTAIIMIGDNNDRLFHTFSPVMEKMYEVETMEQAVQLAYRLSEPKTNVLLSPAAKADLQYADSQDRARQFIKAVKNI